MLEKLPHAIGHALKGRRPGLEATLYETVAADAPELIVVESAAFLEGEAIPVRFTADGEGVSPPLRWSGAPGDAAAVLVVVEDADSPTGKPLAHLVARRPGGDGAWLEGTAGREAEAAVGRNSFLKHAWTPPDPPPGHGPHRYVFQVFALRDAGDLAEAPSRGEAAKAMEGNVLAKGRLIATYERA